MTKPPTIDKPGNAVEFVASSFWCLPVVSLWRREVVRFWRQKSRVVGALGTPVVFWLLLGSGLGSSFRHQLRVPSASAGAESPGAVTDSMNYLEYAFPGAMVLIVMFTAIFSMISIIEDRREGFMQAVIAAPVRRSAIVIGKVAGSATLAVAQALVFMLLAPLAGLPLSVASVAAALAVLVLLAFSLSALGFLVAWPMESTQGFHAVMNLFLMPLWLLSGALFPAAGAHSWLAWIMAINPLTYGVSALRNALYLAGGSGSWPGFPITALVITVLFAVAMLVFATRVIELDR